MLIRYGNLEWASYGEAWAELMRNTETENIPFSMVPGIVYAFARPILPFLLGGLIVLLALALTWRTLAQYLPLGTVEKLIASSLPLSKVI